MRLAEEATSTWASVQSSIRLQFPGDEIQKPAGGVMAELILHRQGCAHWEQETWNRLRVTLCPRTRAGTGGGAEKWEASPHLPPYPMWGLGLKRWNERK